MTVVLDPGVLLNLAAAQVLPEFVGEDRFIVAAPEEMQPLVLKTEGTLKALDLRMVSGALHFTPSVEADEEERGCFLDYLVCLTAGEAAAAAHAERHRLMLASDESKVCRVFQDRVCDPNRTISTVALLQRWNSTLRPRSERLRAVLCAIVDGANFQPRPRTKEAQWWDAVLSGDVKGGRDL